MRALMTSGRVSHMTEHTSLDDPCKVVGIVESSCGQSIDLTKGEVGAWRAIRRRKPRESIRDGDVDPRFSKSLK